MTTKLSQLINEKEYIRKRLINQKNRREQVNRVIASLTDGVTDNINGVNAKLRSASDGLSAGIKGVLRAGLIASSLSAKQELYNDSMITEPKELLIAERRAINKKIDELNARLTTLNVDIEKEELSEIEAGM